MLDAILGAGARVFFGCKGGGCGVCAMRLTAGRIDHGRYSTSALPDEEREAGWFLSCQARPLGDITVRLTDANRFRKPPSRVWWGTPRIENGPRGSPPAR